jgi:hypothetical protein
MNEEEPTSSETMEVEVSHQVNVDSIVDRLQTKDMIGARQHIRSMLFSKLKDRLDGLNSSTAPLPQQDVQESGVGAAMTTDKLVTSRHGFERHYREFPKEFVWTAEKDGKVIDTATVNSQTLGSTQDMMKEIAKSMAEKGADTIKIQGREGRVLSTMKLDGEGNVKAFESVESGGWSLGSLDDIKGTGKAKKPFHMTNIREKIVKQGSKFVILSKDGSKKLGEYDNEEDAKKRLRQIEFFKSKH